MNARVNVGGRELTRSWCSKHWAVVKDHRRMSGLVACVLLEEFTLRDPKFLRRCGCTPRQVPNPEMARREMERLVHLCCALPQETLARVYLGAVVPRQPYPH